MPLVGPPEGVQLEQLVLFEVCADAPPLVVGQSVAVLLEERVDSRDTSVPRVLQIFQRQTPVLRIRFLSSVLKNLYQLIELVGHWSAKVDCGQSRGSIGAPMFVETISRKRDANFILKPNNQLIDLLYHSRRFVSANHRCHFQEFYLELV